jgi:hypothetical protein
MKTLDDVRADVKELSTDELKAEFAEGIRLTRDRFLRLGAILVELESRGESVEGDKFLIRLLRKIGQGELLIDIVTRFAGKPWTLANVTQLPLKEQRKVLQQDDRTVEGQYGLRSRKRTKPGRGKCEMEFPSMKEMAAHASPGDIAEMCLELIMASESPQAVAEKLIPELQTLKNRKRSRQSFSEIMAG